MYWPYWYEVELDEETVEMEGEMVDELDVFGYMAVTPKASQTASVKVFFYYKAPSSEWYWDYAYGVPYCPVIPVVFSCDADWKLTGILNSSLYEVVLDGKSDGWIEMNVTLKRKLVANEKIFFGVYSDILGPVGTHDTDPTKMCRLYFSSERRNDYSSQTAYISSASWISKSQSIEWYNDICCYLQYENESIAYARTVLGNVGAATDNSRKSVWKRTLLQGGNVTSSLSRKSVWKRTLTQAGNVASNLSRKTDWKKNAVSSGSCTSILQSHNRMSRNRVSGVSVSDSNSRRIFIFRNLENIMSAVSRNYINCSMRISELEEIGLYDVLTRHAWLKKNCGSNAKVLSLNERKNSLCRGIAARIKPSEAHSKKLCCSRMIENSGLVNAGTDRALNKKIEETDVFSSWDSLQRLLFIMRLCFSSSGVLERLEQKADYKRLSESVVDDEEEVSRCGESFRKAMEEAEVSAQPFASRLFFRTVQTVMGFWDWLRGKIREANNVVTFFCPIHLEVELECYI